MHCTVTVDLGIPFLVRRELVVKGSGIQSTLLRWPVVTCDRSASSWKHPPSQRSQLAGKHAVKGCPTNWWKISEYSGCAVPISGGYEHPGSLQPSFPLAYHSDLSETFSTLSRTTAFALSIGCLLNVRVRQRINGLTLKVHRSNIQGLDSNLASVYYRLETAHHSSALPHRDPNQMPNTRSRAQIEQRAGICAYDHDDSNLSVT